MTTSGAHPYLIERKVCVDCQQPYYSWGAHAERCPGPRQRIAAPPEREPECGCPPGWQHLRDCPERVGFPDEAA